MKLRGLIPNFHIHVSVSDLYIPRIEPHILQGGPIVGINKSLTDTVHECGNEERGRVVSFLTIHKSDLPCSVYLCYMNTSLV
jgi:hypothetical protein